MIDIDHRGGGGVRIGKWFILLWFILVPRVYAIITYTLFRSRGANELKNLQYCLPRASEPRETFVEDRTKAHADHIGQGFDRQTTGAVAVLKAVHCNQK